MTDHDGRCILQATTIRPGDHIVVTVPDHRDHDGLRKMLTDLRERFPDNEITLVNAQGIAVQRAEDLPDLTDTPPPKED